jgi:hypothetical protein
MQSTRVPHSETLRRGLRRRVAGVRESDPFQGILLVRTYDDLVPCGIYHTLHKHDGTDSTSPDRETVLSASIEPNGTVEDPLLASVRSVFISQTSGIHPRQLKAGYFRNATNERSLNE